MPELPEVETVVRELKPHLEGKRIEKVIVSWRRTINGSPTDFRNTLAGAGLLEIQRRGKYICFHCSHNDAHFTFTTHLKMTGKLVFRLAAKDKKHVRVRFRLSDGGWLYFVDMRKFGRMQLWPTGTPLLPQLGPEPLHEENVASVLKSLTSVRAIKTVLMDQTVLAGIGNIYADEALFRAGIHPLTPAKRLTEHQKDSLSHYIPEILSAAIKRKGTTLAQYRRPDDTTGNNQLFLQVYGCDGHPCLTCGTVVMRIIVNGRSSHFCPNCQPMP